MGVLEGANREQATIWSLEDMVGEEAMVRVIDRFIDVTNLEKLGFANLESAVTGRPRYPVPALAKLYVYGYENGIRSSRKLERETYRNIEVMWLTGTLQPDHKTIAEFRRANIRPLQKLFREFVRLCRSWDLVGGNLFAVDGTKIKASNNKKSNFSRKKLDKRLEHLDERINSYLTEMDETDRSENSQPALEGLQKLLERKELYESYVERLNETNSNELSTVDPDARLMGNNRGGVDVAYNVQSAVDGENHIIVDYDVTLNPSDQGKLSYMAKRLKRQGYKKFKLVADKGYYNGRDLAKVKRYKITAIVSRQDKSDRKELSEVFHNEKFKYDKSSDTYLCPTGKTLHPHNKKTAKRRNFFNKTACSQCRYVNDCAANKQWRTVTRGEYGDVYDEAGKVFKANIGLYKLRQQIVEHPFGTIKHTMNGGYFLLRTRPKVRCEVALLMLGYNLKRAMKELGFKELMSKLAAFSQQLLPIPLLYLKRTTARDLATARDVF